MKNIIGKINVFVLLTICYVILTFAVKISELIFTLSTDVVIEDFSGMLYGNLVSALFVGLCIFLPYLLISSVSKKIATYISAVLFSIMLLFETGLVIYHVTTGLLMGSELVNRPLWEILHTIGGVVDIWIIILSFMVMLLLTLLFVRFSRICVCSRCSWIIVTLMFVSVPHGTKGFQFGDIPECNSLFTILKDNGYRSSVFYSGSFNFDRVADVNRICSF